MSIIPNNIKSKARKKAPITIRSKDTEMMNAIAKRSKK
jgi:hypothetical protein